MQKIPHQAPGRNRWRPDRADILTTRGALHLLRALRTLARRHPISSAWDAARLQALLTGDVGTDSRARAYTVSREAARLLVDAPGEALRGLIAGLEEAMNARERGGPAV